MQSKTSDYWLEAGFGSSSLTADLLRLDYLAGDTVRQTDQPHRPFLGGIPGLLFAATLTAPIVYFNPQQEFIRSGLYSVAHSVRKRKRLSLKAARQHALRVLAETEVRLRLERAEEAEFLAALWQPENNDLSDGRA